MTTTAISLGDLVRVKPEFGQVLLEALAEEGDSDYGDLADLADETVTAPDGRVFGVSWYTHKTYGGTFGLVVDQYPTPDGMMYQLDSSDTWCFYGWQLEAVGEEEKEMDDSNMDAEIGGSDTTVREMFVKSISATCKADEVEVQRTMTLVDLESVGRLYYSGEVSLTMPLIPGVGSGDVLELAIRPKYNASDYEAIRAAKIAEDERLAQK